MKTHIRDFTIGEAAHEARIKVPTVRYYEEAGLMPKIARSEGNQRLYRSTHVRRLQFIRHARELGFDLAAIRALLKLQDDPHQSCDQVDAIARARLDDVNKRIASLQALRTELESMVRGCATGQIEECQVIEALTALDHDHGRLAV